MILFLIFWVRFPLNLILKCNSFLNSDNPESRKKYKNNEMIHYNFEINLKFNKFK